MKITKLLKKAKPFLSDKERSNKKKRKYLKLVIKKLKNYEKDLREKIQKEGSPADQRIQKKIMLAHSQRKKALKKHKALLKK